MSPRRRSRTAAAAFGAVLVQLGREQRIGNVRPALVPSLTSAPQGAVADPSPSVPAAAPASPTPEAA